MEDQESIEINMIRIENVHKSLQGTEVLTGVSLAIRRGQVIALVGESGGGKTVLLKCVAGLMKPDRGRVFVHDHDVSTLRGRALIRLRERVGFLFQTGALFDSMTLFENIAFPLREKTSLDEETILKKVQDELTLVGLGGSDRKYPSQISGGMVKRAALARELISEPEIMLFDEPTTGLDPVIGLAILRLIDRLHRRLSFTGIIVTHEIPRVLDIVDGVAMLRDGTVYFYGTPKEFMASSDPIVREFAHGSTQQVRDPSVS